MVPEIRIGLSAALIIALFPPWVVADTLHVPGDHATIQACIDAAFDGDECVVAPGLYNETINFVGKAITVQSSDGPGGTIIDGGGATVVSCGSGEGRDTVLRGFTITGGVSSLTSFGGGMRNDNGSSPTVLDCIFEGNVSTIDGDSDGGGMYNTANSSPLVIACTFRDNRAEGSNGQGGGMLNGTGCNPELVDCLFDGNHADLEGGAIFNFASSPIITNCTFVQNTAGTRGGGISSSSGGTGAHPTIVNCILWGNSAGLRGESDQIYDESGSASVAIFSCIQGCATFCDNPAAANIGADPQFVNIDGPDGIPGNEDDNLRLSSGSPCIDVGDNDAVLSDADLDGKPRIIDGNDDCDPIVDMGAYEFGPTDDCNSNWTPDVCDIANGASQDCNTNGIPDECEPDCDGDGTPDDCEPDCQPNGVPDDCDIATGASEDCNGNGIPDECELDGNDCNNNGIPDECDIFPPLPADPPNDRLKNRYISLRPNNPCLQVKLKVTLTDSLPHPGSVGDSWWVLAPIVPDAANPKPLLGPGECVALLGPENMAAEIDWDAAGCQVLHVTGCPIEPTSKYDVRAVNGTTESLALSVRTILRPGVKWWCDTVGLFNGTEWTPPQGVTNIDDCVAIIKTWQGGPIVAPDGAVAHLSVCDVEPGDINTVVNFADVFTCIQAFQGEEYPFGPADADGNCP